jgi:hypothetical protein
MVGVGAEGWLEGLESRVLMAADPVSPDHPLWVIPRGAAVVDGVLNDADWAGAGEVLRTVPTRDDNGVSVRMMYNDQGVFYGVTVQDFSLWADGTGSGAGNRWEVEQDDSFTVYFDADNSRDLVFGASDRAFGINLGASTDPINRGDGGAVRRYKLVKGDGAGGAPDANPGGDLASGTQYVTSLQGTVNNGSDRDTGWVTEVFLPWAALGMSGAPVNGQTVGMNFVVIQDGAGGSRDLTDHRGLADRFTTPHFVDDEAWGVHSSYSATQAGVRGPVNYAEAMFVDARAGSTPAAVAVSSVTNVTAFGARLNFTAPAGTSGGTGHVAGYQVRYSASAINSEGKWVDAAVFANAYVPRLRGLAESLRLVELSPGTTYHVAVRAVDAAGNLGPISADATFTTSALPFEGYKGNVVPSPMGRTLQYENGESFVVVGDHLGISWQYTRTLFPGLIWDNVGHQFLNFNDAQHRAVEDIDAYMNELRAHGVNTMRTYLELENVHVAGNPGPLPQGTYWIENTPGSYNPSMRQFVLNLLDRAAAHGIHVILSPFDTFSYDEAFGVEGPWAQSRGGPLSTIDHFFQNPLGTVNQQTLNIAKARMLAVVGWVNESAHKDRLLGYEFLSEWDSYEWTLHPDGGGESGRETELRTRAVYMNDLAGYVKSISPEHLVLNSTITHDPRGPVARLDFLSRSFDALTPHMYTSGNEEPINNPQSDTKVLPAREMGYFTAYWVANRTDRAPILNGEWGMTRAAWPGGVPAYSASFTQAEDEAIYRTVTWSGLASGQAGTGLRIAADELAFRGYLLTDAMRDTQLVVSNFVQSTSLAIDFGSFTYENLAGRVRATSVAGKSLLAWGISDGAQGLVYVLQNTNATTGTVTDGRLTIDGLRADQIVDAEVWSTAAGTTAPMATRSGVFVGTGQYVIDLPSFAQDVVVKFKARASAGSTERIVSASVGELAVTIALGPDNQPTARILNTSTGQVSTQNIATLAGFRGQAADLTAYNTPDGVLHLAVTDTRHHLWVFTGDVGAGTWSAQNLTALTGFAGMTGDLTSYQPSWGAVHIAGLDARGHAINYWWAPAEPFWHFTDLTGSFGGPGLQGGLTGYVSGWDGLNLAGLDADRNLIVYWWAPGIEHINGGDPGRWLAQNMTADFSGPRFTGQLDAYVTPWGGLNVAGTTDAGEVWAYWWAPGLNPEPNRWRITSLSASAGESTPWLANVNAYASPFDGSINIYGVDGSGNLRSLRWTPVSQQWVALNGSSGAGNVPARWPVASTATSGRIVVSAGGPPGDRTVVLFSYFGNTNTWQAVDTDMVLAP